MMSDVSMINYENYSFGLSHGVLLSAMNWPPQFSSLISNFSVPTSEFIVYFISEYSPSRPLSILITSGILGWISIGTIVSIFPI